MLSDARYKELMQQVGLPDSRTLLQTLKQCANEAARVERECCAYIAESFEPDEKSPGVDYASTQIRARTYGHGT